MPPCDILFKDKRTNLDEGINRRVSNSPNDAKAASPYHQSDNIKAPLLLMHGEKDTVVPVKHSRRMHKKMKMFKKPVRYIELEKGEHWIANDQHELTKYREIERFLHSNLK